MDKQSILQDLFLLSRSVYSLLTPVSYNTVVAPVARTPGHGGGVTTRNKTFNLYLKENTTRLCPMYCQCITVYKVELPIRFALNVATDSSPSYSEGLWFDAVLRPAGYTEYFVVLLSCSKKMQEIAQ
jgi:hypothetical protein